MPDGKNMPAKPLILVAEDEVSDRSLLSRAVERAGLQVRLEFAKDGLELISRLRAGASEASLLLLDLDMPGMNGFEVLEWLREHLDMRPGYVVVLSGSSDGDDLRRASELGVDHYLVKPGDPAELLATLKRLEPYWAEGRRGGFGSTEAAASAA